MGSLISASLVAFSIRWIIEYVCSAFVTLCAPAPAPGLFIPYAYTLTYTIIILPFSGVIAAFYFDFSTPLSPLCPDCRLGFQSLCAFKIHVYRVYMSTKYIGNALRTLVCMYNFTHISGSIRNNIMNVSCSNVELATYSISSERPFSQKLKPNNAHRITMKNKDGEWREVRRSEEKRKELRQLQ